MQEAPVLAQRIVEESMVLLLNHNQTLPLTTPTRVAFFGRACLEPFISGNGSGTAQAQNAPDVLTACETVGLTAVASLHRYYQQYLKSEPKPSNTMEWNNIAKMAQLVHSGVVYEYFSEYRPTPTEIEVPYAVIAEAAQSTDTAILVFGRNAGGEECDRHMENDYMLSKTEERLVAQICQAFARVILILNINGLVDLAWIESYSEIQSVLYWGLPGEGGTKALARVLSGQVSPSGKLAFSIPRKCSDLPCFGHFSWNKNGKVLEYQDYALNAAANGSIGFERSPVTVYQEDLYLGYRYFDSFGVQPLFPFGFGLSYSEFDIQSCSVYRQKDNIVLMVRVCNAGNFAGREVVQLYVEPHCTRIRQPRQLLKAFAKTKLLQPGEATEVQLSMPCRELAVFDEASASWVIPSGQYRLLVGNSSRSTELAATIVLNEEKRVQKAKNMLTIQTCNKAALSFLEAGKQHGLLSKPEECLDLSDWLPAIVFRPSETTRDLGTFSTEELAALCVGYGPGTPFSAFGDSDAPETICDEKGNPLAVNDHPTGMNGYVSPAIPVKGIHSLFYKDGPAGIGGIAWPCEMLLACSFDRELCYCMGDAIGAECEQQRVDIWLAPAVNLQRHPLCGRNFEYFSEDPFLTGACAVAVSRGVEEKHAVLVCPKHFACNEQETYRRGNARRNVDAVDSILTPRAARELYLKPFEMLVCEGGIQCLMTSFNKINGTFAAANEELCTGILRNEWGFRGMVVTDWCDMDQVADGADAILAGNDIIMPGGPPVIRQILDGLQHGIIQRKHLERSVSRLLGILQQMRIHNGTR